MTSTQTIVKSKLQKTRQLLNDHGIRPYIPETKKLSSENLHQMLQKYGMVYVKPDEGRYGIGVMRVEVLPDQDGNCYRLSFGRRTREYASYEELASAVKRVQAGRAYVVQHGIHVLTHNHRAFDIRIMVQRRLKRKWVATGYVARVAAPRRIVTNFHGGGTPQALPRILERYLAKAEVADYIGRLCRLGERVAKRCQKTWPSLQSVGLDIAIDQEMRPWILEVNTQPLADLFAKLRDKKMFRTILRYARASREYANRRQAVSRRKYSYRRSSASRSNNRRMNIGVR